MATPTGSGRAVVAWSSGKDAAFALAEVQRAAALEVVGLLTTVTEGYERVSMHGVRRALVHRQAERLGLPLTEVRIPPRASNAQYDAAMGAAVAGLQRAGVTHVVFGDLFLEDVRRYREERMRGSGVVAEFPLWGRPTGALAATMIASGMRARLVCVDPRQIPGSLAGAEFDEELLARLPSTADPCGERGEFHTFVYDAPNFRAPIALNDGPVVVRDGFVFADVEEAAAGGRDRR